MPALRFTLWISYGNHDQQEDAQSQTWNICKDKILEDKVDQIEILPRCTCLNVYKSGDENDPKISCHNESQSSDHANLTKYCVSLIDCPDKFESQETNLVGY